MQCFQSLAIFLGFGCALALTSFVLARKFLSSEVVVGAPPNFPDERKTSTGTISPVDQLAKFFPESLRIHIPVNVSFPDRSTERSYDTILQFGTSLEVLFTLNGPVEFAERLLLTTNDGSLNIEAHVVAIQTNEGKVAVAAKFKDPVPNWIIRK